MKIFQAIRLCLVLTLCLLLACCFMKKTQPAVTFTVIDNNIPDKFWSATLEIDNLESLAHSGRWQLAFNALQPIIDVEGGENINIKQGGDFYLIEFKLAKNSKKILFKLKGRGVILNYSDAPQGYFLVGPFKPNSKPSTVIINSKTILLPWKATPEEEAQANIKKNNTQIEGNPAETTLSANDSLIVPLPVELHRFKGEFELNEDTQVIYNDKRQVKPINFFIKAIKPATGFKLNKKKYLSGTPLKNKILLTTEGISTLNKLQCTEGYILEVNPSLVIIRACSEAGFFYGFQSLRQLLPPQIYNKKIQQIDWKITSIYIRDYPRFKYRGLELDVARHFFPVDQIKRVLDLMALHKLNYFQWHLTDDEGWRIEIKKYPELTKKGAWRGYDPAHDTTHDLLPAYGSGPKPYGGFYTQKEIRAIVKYAQARQITIIPEIDMPGHARALKVSLPDKLIDRKDQSEYTSAQGYHDNVLSPCKKETYEVIDNIITEVAQLFPGKYLHAGGDEVPGGAWEKSCMAKEYDPASPHFREQVQNAFMKRIQKIIESKGKIMAGWEEVADNNSTLSSPLLVYAWNPNKLDEVYEKSAKEGYCVVMAPTTNLYFDLAYSSNPNEPGQYWAGYGDTFSAYVFQPIDKEKGQNKRTIIGVQGQLWTELIDSSKRLDYHLFPKMSALSELAWSPSNRRNWRNFSARMAEKHLSRLFNYGVNYREGEF